MRNSNSLCQFNCPLHVVTPSRHTATTMRTCAVWPPRQHLVTWHTPTGRLHARFDRPTSAPSLAEAAGLGAAREGERVRVGVRTRRARTWACSCCAIMAVVGSSMLVCNSNSCSSSHNFFSRLSYTCTHRVRRTILAWCTGQHRLSQSEHVLLFRVCWRRLSGGLWKCTQAGRHNFVDVYRFIVKLGNL